MFIKYVFCQISFTLISYRYACPRVFSLGMRTVLIFVLAFGSWIVDRCFCVQLFRAGIPYFHCLWHVGILLSSYQTCVLFCYFSAMAQVPERAPVLRLWPSETYGIWGVPYVDFKLSQHNGFAKAI